MGGDAARAPPNGASLSSDASPGDDHGRAGTTRSSPLNFGVKQLLPDSSLAQPGAVSEPTSLLIKYHEMFCYLC